MEPTTETPDIEHFDEWDLDDAVLDALEDMNIVHPTPVQKLAIGPVLAGRDIVAKAETGTGKTLAFGAPIISRVDPDRNTVLALVLCPTRELAGQVADVLAELGEARGIKVALIVGGEELQPQVHALRGGAQIVVATPGRVLDLMGQRFLTFPWTEFVVLDEADKMFEIGFLDDVRKILAATPPERQTMLFSATYVDEVLTLAREVTREPVEIATAAGVATVDTIRQHWLDTTVADRHHMLARLVERSHKDDVFLVFCERRTDVDELHRRLRRMLEGTVTVLHGGYDQDTRFRVMSLFRAGEVKVLVATDVAARGLDVHRVSHVINYQVPRELEDYTHRIGRTGRAGRKGTAITFVTPEDERRWKRIIGSVDWDIDQLDPPSRKRTRSR